MLSRVAAAGQFPGFCKWTYAAAAVTEHAAHHEMSEGQPPRTAAYLPQFFSPAEFAVVERLADIIIPADETPGAKEAGVAEFIDFMVANETETMPRFRDGLKWLDEFARRSAGAGFTEIVADRQESLLAQLAYREKFQPGEEAGRAFFKLMRRYTVMGYYTSRAGLKALDYPGLKLYQSSPACPHQDDPEHRHLPPPRY